MSNHETAEALKRVLADSYVLYLKTQNYHWNVTGPNFQSLHALFESQYTELATAIDEIAELIRGLGHKAPGSLAAFSKMTSLKEADDSLDAIGMVKDLHDSNHQIQTILQEAFETAQNAEDEVIVGAMTERMTVHRKASWMLKSSI